MKKNLIRNNKNEIWYYENGKKIIGIHDNIHGYVSEIEGNLDNCEITNEERSKGINIEDLIKPE